MESSGDSSEDRTQLLPSTRRTTPATASTLEVKLAASRTTAFRLKIALAWVLVCLYPLVVAVSWASPRCRATVEERRVQAALDAFRFTDGFDWMRSPAAVYDACPSKARTTITHGVYPMLRELGCGHENLEVPRLLRQQGNGRVVVDVGLAFDALETEAAVANGFNVIGFEPDPPNVAALRKKFARDSRIHVVDLVSGAAAAAPALAAAMWRLPASVLKAKFPPLDPVSGRGTAYIIAAGLDETNGVAHMGGAASKEAHRATGELDYGANIGKVSTPGSAASLGPGDVPIVTLDSILPQFTFVSHITFVKIDTQGWELKVLKGARESLKRRMFTYVQYELSPWLMRRSKTGDAAELVQLLPSLGGICFDMMEKDSHNRRPRPSTPLSGKDSFLSRLDSGKGSTHLVKTLTHAQIEAKEGDDFGPWDDVTCYFPQ